MKTPVRLRAWHSPIIEDAEGATVCVAPDLSTASRLVLCLNTLHALCDMPDDTAATDMTIAARAALRLPITGPRH